MCAGLPNMTELTNGACKALLDTSKSLINKECKTLLKAIKDAYDAASKGTPTIEDYLSELIDLDAICDRRADLGIDVTKLDFMGTKYSHSDIHDLMIAIKQHIFNVLSQPVTNISYHRKFVAGLHRRLRAGAEANKRPINYFILNYDTLIEDALALEKIHCIDGFMGSSTAWWSFSSIFEKDNTSPSIEARVIKLHGSIDWRYSSDSYTPMRIRDTVRALCLDSNAEPIVIYPASAKYREVERDPFAQLMRFFRSTLQITEDHILGIMGYGFSDNHINSEINNALEKSNGKLSIIVFFAEKNLPDQLSSILNSPYADQVQVYSPEGVYVGSSPCEPIETDPEWYKFEWLSQLVGGST